jgi:hypothetical protein
MISVKKNPDGSTKTIEEEQTQTIPSYPCGRIPIMVGSKFCVLSDQTNFDSTARFNQTNGFPITICSITSM